MAYCFHHLYACHTCSQFHICAPVWEDENGSRYWNHQLHTIHAHHVIDSWVNLVRHLPFATAWANGSVSSISSMWERQGYINMPYMLHNFEQFSQFLSVLTSHESGSRQLILWTSPCALHKSLPLNLYYFVAWGAWFHVKGLFVFFCILTCLWEEDSITLCFFDVRSSHQLSLWPQIWNFNMLNS